jgi:hypothetical protein
MKITFIGLLLCMLTSMARAQTYSVQWGEEMKLKKGSMDFDIVNADETGVYVLEGKLKMKSYFVIGATYGTTYKLIKFDKNYNEVYQQEYRKELKGLNFKSIQFLKNDMFLFADDYTRKEKKYTIYGMKLDRKTGAPMGEMNELASFQLESKKDDFDYSFTPSPDSSAWLLVGDVSTDMNTAISINTFDRNLARKGSTQINLVFDPKSFVLEDVLPTADNKFLILGKQYEMVPTGKRNKTARTFTKYVFSKYDSKGKKEMDLPTDVSSHYAMSGKAIYFPNGELAMAGFYSNNPKKTEVNGFFLHKVDVLTGTILQSSYKEISADMLDQAVDDNNDLDDDQKKQKKEEEKAKDKVGDDDGISRDFIIRGVEFNPVTRSLVLVAELSQFRFYTTSYYNSTSKTWEYRNHYNYTNSDVLVINTNSQGQIEWINTLPKRQIETITSSGGGGAGIYFSSDVSGYFARGGGMPFYSSFGYMLRENKLIFLLNDHQQNAGVRKLGDKLKSVTNFRKSVAYAVSLDLKTGQFTRKLLLSNEDDPVLMPRFSFVVDRDFYLPAMKMKALGKTEFKIGKVTVKSL